MPATAEALSPRLKLRACGFQAAQRCWNSCIKTRHQGGRAERARRGKERSGGVAVAGGAAARRLVGRAFLPTQPAIRSKQGSKHGMHKSTRISAWISRRCGWCGTSSPPPPPPPPPHAPPRFALCPLACGVICGCGLRLMLGGGAGAAAAASTGAAPPNRSPSPPAAAAGGAARAATTGAAPPLPPIRSPSRSRGEAAGAAGAAAPEGGREGGRAWGSPSSVGPEGQGWPIPSCTLCRFAAPGLSIGKAGRGHSAG